MNILSKYQCAFWKDYIAQRWQLAKWEKWKPAVDSSYAYKALIADLAKAFDSLLHEVLIAEINAQRFQVKALKLMNNYLSQTNQRTKINKFSSSCEKIIVGVPQGSVIRPIF